MTDKFELGSRLRDKVDGMTGIATARCLYLNGCVQYCIKPHVDKDGKNVDGMFVDEQQLELVDEGVLVSKPAPKIAATGGPAMDTPSDRP